MYTYVHLCTCLVLGYLQYLHNLYRIYTYTCTHPPRYHYHSTLSLVEFTIPAHWRYGNKTMSNLVLGILYWAAMWAKSRSQINGKLVSWPLILTVKLSLLKQWNISFALHQNKALGNSMTRRRPHCRYKRSLVKLLKLQMVQYLFDV